MPEEDARTPDIRRAGPPRPPQADEVSYCPPHFWIVEEGWEQCCKCGDRRQIQTPYQTIKIL